MTKYIDKSALVAEIKSKIKEIDEIGTYLSPKGVLTNLLCHLDTIEVKEVDLEHEVESYWKQCNMTWCRDAYSMTHIRSMLSDIAKHFFGLGIKAQKL